MDLVNRDATYYKFTVARPVKRDATYYHIPKSLLGWILGLKRRIVMTVTRRISVTFFD